MEPPKYLLDKILKRIHKEERLLVLRKTIFLSVLLIISLAGFIPSFNMLSADFGRTGFVSFFSLAFTDFYSISVHWQSFTMILLETLPALSLALFLAVLLTFLQSTKSLTKNIKIIIKSKPLTAN